MEDPFVLPGGWEFLLIVRLIINFFGAKMIPGLDQGIGRDINEFKKGMRKEAGKQTIEHSLEKMDN